MTKSQAFDILSDKIKGLCVSDFTYNDKTSATATYMIAILSEIDATNDTLIDVLDKEKTDDR